MKKLSLYILFLFLVSCNSDETTLDQPIINIEIAEINYLDVQNTQKLIFSTNNDWTISIEYIGEQRNWLTVSQQSGNVGNFWLDLTATTNDLYEKREAKLTITAGSAIKTLSISQKHKGAIVLSQDRYAIDFEGADLVVELKSSIVYDLIIKSEFQSWITDVTKKGRSLDDYTHTFHIASAENSRSGYIIFKEKDTLLADTVRINQTGKSDVYAIERAALMDLYNSTGGEKWSANVNWGSNEPLSEWGGLSFDDNGFVSKIKLINRNLEGTLPNSLGNLRSLAMLELNDNKLSGNIPSSLLQNPHFNDFVFHFIRQSDGYEFANLKDINYKAPAFSLTDLENKTINSSELFAKNKLTLLYAWGSTNLPARLLNYDLYPLFEAFKEKGLGLVGFSTETESIMKTYVSNEKMPWTNVQDRENYFTNKLLSKGKIPVMMLVDQQGNVVFDIKPFESNTPNLLNKVSEFIEAKLGEPNPVHYYTSSDMSMDGEVVTLQRATVGNGVNILFLADGFVDKDMVSGGKWERAINDAFRHFFSVEPTKTYREHFNVYAVKVVSKNDVYYENNRYADSETALKVSFGEGTRINTKDAMASCRNYANKVGVDLTNAPVTIVVNSSRYSGTAYWFGSGESYSFVPMPTVRGIGEEEFREILLHESVGHGFSRLLDEYQTFYTQIPADKIATFNSNRAMGLGFNLTVDKENDVPWRKFMGLAGYEMVDLFEGGFLYSKGVWRAEENQCMNNNVPYFNAPSRELFVKRMRNLAQEPHSWEDFLTKDKYEPINVKSGRGLSPYLFVPLAPPVFIEK